MSTDTTKATQADESWLNAEEATAYLSLPSRKALYAAVQRGQLPCHRWGRRIRFKRVELDRVLSSRGWKSAVEVRSRSACIVSGKER